MNPEKTYSPLLGSHHLVAPGCPVQIEAHHLFDAPLRKEDAAILSPVDDAASVMRSVIRAENNALRHTDKIASYVQDVIAEKLGRAYLASHPDCSVHWVDTSEGPVGGVETKVGQVSDFLRHVTANTLRVFVTSEQCEIEPVIPQDVQQMCRELTRGILAYRAYPFVAQHMNEDGMLASVLHPCYRRTMVGEGWG